MHYWGDWPDEMFSQVSKAARDIGQFCRRWGRIPVTQTKEKYGTVRVYCGFGCDDLHGLIYPGYAYVRGPYRLMTFPFFRPFRRLTHAWQHFIYRWAYKRALKKYPAIREEILDCADWPEYLEAL